jgi:hypothetical protein
VEISPRWYFAQVQKTSVNVGYGGDGNQVGYTYAFDSRSNRVEINLTGKFEKFTLRIPFPEKAKGATASLNGKAVVLTADQVNQSRYAVVQGSGSVGRVVVRFN